MLCPICQTTAQRYGKNRNGGQRYRCHVCPRTFTDYSTRTDGRRLDSDKLILCLRMILEGNSVRSTERLTGAHRDTIIAAIVDAGEKCEAFLTETVKGVPVTDVQADEIWGFVGCKQRTAEKNGYGPEVGDGWCFVGLDRTSRLVLAWHLDKRTPDATIWFIEKLQDATTGRFQLTTDGFKPYSSCVSLVFGHGIDYAQLVKHYATAPQRDAAARYSPGEVIDVETIVRIGNPDPDKVCTSHSERANLSIRMAIRRMTRLTNAHSKKWENHKAALALWFAYYNFCRVHSTIKSTPAVAAGLTDRTWSVAELLARVAE